MKLQPKARPVQISKLRLGGKAINTKEDLLNNFYFSEIIELGDKFIQWINRHDEVKDSANRVSQIFSGAKNKSQKAQDLLVLFFPEYKNKSLDDVLCDWHMKLINTKILEDLLSCVKPNISTAEILMTECHEDNLWMQGWLENCAKEASSSQSLTPEFCFKYGLFCQQLSKKEESNRWMRKAEDLGHPEAKKFVMKENLNISISIIEFNYYRTKINLAFKLVHTDPLANLESFYICEDIVRGYGNEGNKLARFQCLSLINEICKKTGYRINFPTLKQMKIAREKIELKRRKHEQEFLNRGIFYVPTEEHYAIDEGNVYFRPVLNFDENSSLL